MKLATLKGLNAARRGREAVALVTDLGTGVSRLVHEHEVAADPLADELSARLVSGASGLVATGPNGQAFVTVSSPPPRLVVIGAVHVSQALAPVAALAGFDVTIIDPRTAFATDERFRDIRLIAEWPADALPKVGGLDRFTALAALTHDPKIDDDAIVAALDAGCFYVGALGSSKTHAKRLDRLRAAGVSDASLRLIRAPIGLPIGAQSPAEIAIAIAGEIIGAWRNRGAAAKEAAA
jgi:xanthine dehydrogenase accessory factor